MQFEPVMGIELMTSSLPRMRSTPELHRLLIRAEDEVRTRDPQLGRLMLYQLSYFRKILWEEVDSNHRTRRSGFTVRRNCRYAILPSCSEFASETFEPMEGVEPTTPRLQITCSGQLSYIGGISMNVPSQRDCKDRQ